MARQINQTGTEVDPVRVQLMTVCFCPGHHIGYEEAIGTANVEEVAILVDSTDQRRPFRYPSFSTTLESGLDDGIV